ncbi:LysR family transcriptional regulator [Spartinivicinus poritis]|uniref:LysR family transcriptional regulator n=1 Tax=Spartinivicinus poritis TaxID=2994640 RepID=A0ABT5UDU1_9GAMM|nr:LysR family transcriptional regulator [Spartinivicinus sp. A2-2]MDE1464539.1 LysR family transcriptional regulator [Spartinivicinus sp. A2-2]
MSIKALRALKAIAETGSFAAASDQLGLTLSAVSLQIKTLEQQLNTSLFDRSGRNAKLNHNGQQVLARAEQILNLYNQLGYDLDDSEHFSGQYSLGAIHSVQIGPLAPILASLHKDHPNLQIKVRRGQSAELAKGVEKNRLDAALITEPITHYASNCSFTPYAEEPFYIVSNQGTTIANETKLLHQVPFIRFDKKAWAGAIIDEELMQRGIQVNEWMELDSMEAALRMVEYGLGITIMPLSRQRSQQLAKSFQLIPFGAPPLKRSIGVYQKLNNSRAPVTKLVYELMVKNVIS